MKKKTEGQPNLSTRIPPTKGPRTAIPPEKPDHRPIAFPLDFFGKQTFIMANDPGTIMAAPMPTKT